MELTRLVSIKKYRGQHPAQCEDMVVREAPFTLFLNDEELVTLVCTPDGLKELATGFLCSEGFLHKIEDLKNIKINSDDGFIWAETASPVPLRENFLKRYITTCCGKGRASFYFINDAKDLKPIEPSNFRIAVETVTNLSSKLEERAGLFRSTGGAHGAALCSPEEILAHYEDIGRHNAVDKILGHCFLGEIPLSDKVMVISGRVSSEILIKVARMGVPFLISRSAPTDLALEMADYLGITVAGFARGDRVNIYTHPERITS
ncbi:MAG: formate dehydrogenase accessory sulfurtransferase FdhD [Desulfocucumaceae bacterium]